MAGRCWNQIKKPPNRSSFIEQKKELLVLVYSFLFVSDMLEERKQRYCINFFLLYAHKPVAIFSFFSRVLNF